eukprot:XP_001690229.1 predicted protein [Chlamydomonas reinhardtii]
MASVALAVFLSGVVAGRLIERRQQRRRAGGGGSGHEAGEGEAAAAATAADGGAARPLTPPELQPHQPHHLRSMDRPHLHPLPHSDSFLQHAEPTTPTVRVQPATAAATSGTAQELTAVPQAAQLPQQPRQQRRWRLLGLIPMGRGGRDSSEEQGAAAPNGSYADSGGGSGGGGGGGGTITGTDTSTVSTGRTPAAGGPPVTPPHPHMAHAVPAAGTPFAPTTSAHAPSLPCPSPKPSGAPSSAAASATPATAVTAAAPDAATHLEHPRHVWYVNEQDLQYFRLRAEQDVSVPGAGPWTHMMDKEAARVYRYTAHRRALPSGLTEYRSVTVIPDTSPLECRWEGFMVSAEVLEAGDQRLRQQVVRWIRTFPFGFITDREYVIARALFAVTPDGAVHRGLPPPARLMGHPSGPSASLSALQVSDLYVVTKSIGHPGAADGQHGGKVVTIPEYYSMWRCSMAISMGMSKFVSTMAAAVPGFVAERRRRGLAPTQPDPQPWTPLAATTPSSNGSSAFSVASTPTGPVRALWRPHVASTSPNPHHWPDTDSAGTAGGKTSARGAGGIARFSLTQVAVGGDDIGGGAVAQLEDNAAAAGDGTVQRQKHQEGNGEAAASGAAACGEGVVADAWWSLGRAMSPTGLWRRQDLPKMSSAWGTDPQGGSRKRGGLYRRALLAAAASAGLLLAAVAMFF